MENGVNLTSIYISNIMGLLIIFFIYAGNKWRLQEKTVEMAAIKAVMIALFISCIVDPLVWTLDGMSGTIVYNIVYYGNLWLFFTNMIAGPAWLILITNHVDGQLKFFHKIFLTVLVGIGFGIIIANFFTPCLFEIAEDNTYHRGTMFWYFMAMEVLCIIDSVIIYIRGRRRGGVLKFFPVLQFLVPIIIGSIIQIVFEGVSTIWPFSAIGMCNVMSGLQNEVVFKDQLTGLYNRYYLDNLKNELGRRKNTDMTAIMLDMNGFKTINDTYGHSVGDKALIMVADIIRESVGNLGNAVRYAGDEFIILLNTVDEEETNKVLDRIKERLAEPRKRDIYQFELSVAAGCCTLNFANSSIDDLLNEVDRRMYEDKNRYYAEAELKK